MVEDPGNQTILADLMSHCHRLFRQEILKRWELEGNESITHSEDHLMACVANEVNSISSAARMLNISRQATHKCATKLETKGFIEFVKKDGNKRDKYIHMTPKGQEFYKAMKMMKQEMEAELVEKLQPESWDILKAELFKIVDYFEE